QESNGVWNDSTMCVSVQGWAVAYLGAPDRRGGGPHARDRARRLLRSRDDHGLRAPWGRHPGRLRERPVHQGHQDDPRRHARRAGRLPAGGVLHGHRPRELTTMARVISGLSMTVGRAVAPGGPAGEHRIDGNIAPGDTLLAVLQVSPDL